MSSVCKFCLEPMDAPNKMTLHHKECSKKLAVERWKEESRQRVEKRKAALLAEDHFCKVCGEKFQPKTKVTVKCNKCKCIVLKKVPNETGEINEFYLTRGKILNNRSVGWLQ